jgi:hypothetical protein
MKLLLKQKTPSSLKKMGFKIGFLTICQPHIGYLSTADREALNGGLNRKQKSIKI